MRRTWVITLPAINKVLANITKLRKVAKTIHTSDVDEGEKQILLEDLNENVEGLQKKVTRDMHAKRIY